MEKLHVFKMNAFGGEKNQGISVHAKLLQMAMQVLMQQAEKNMFVFRFPFGYCIFFVCSLYKFLLCHTAESREERNHCGWITTVALTKCAVFSMEDVHCRCGAKF